MYKYTYNTKLIIIISLFCCLIGIQNTLAAGYSHDNGSRVVENINVGWKFYKDDVKGAEAVLFNDGKWDQVNIPHSMEISTFDAPSIYRGIGWYRKSFKIEPSYKDKRVFIDFESAMQYARVWVNGVFVGEHKGGYTPFRFDITDNVKFGSNNIIAMRLDNSPNPDILPGTVVPDYNLYGGIYRDVYIIITDESHILSTFVTTPDVSTESSKVRVRTEVKNDGKNLKNCEMVTTIVDDKNTVIAVIKDSHRIRPGRVYTFDQLSDIIEKPRLWSPETPTLYRVYSVLKSGGKVTDGFESPLGFRWYRFDAKKGFFLNGQPYKLEGVNRHQSYPWLGNAAPNSAQIMDIELVKEMGCNSIRLSHYPQDPVVMDACDRLGLLVWNEIPGWQYVGGDKWIENGVQVMKEMIRRDRNHPSVMVWGFSDEPLEDRLEAFRTLNKTAHVEDPSRPTGLDTYTEHLRINDISDVFGWNFFEPVDILENVAWSAHEKYPERKVLVTEYIGHTSPGKRGEDSERTQAETHEVVLPIFENIEWFSGYTIWSMYDYSSLFQSGEGAMGPEGSLTLSGNVAYHGMCDIFRIPKESFYFYQAQWADEPMAHICGHWTYKKGKKVKVKVYSNCDKIELFVNGRSIGAKDKADSRKYKWKAKFEPGTLKAVGTMNGKEVVDEVHTAGTPAGIGLSAKSAEIVADGTDMSWITAIIVDDKGVAVPGAGNNVNFAVSGEGVLIGNRSVKAVNGKLRVIFQSSIKPGPAVITASSDGLASATIMVVSK